MRVAMHFSGLEALRMALEIAHREHRFFVVLARKAKSGSLRDLFSGMAQEKASFLRSLRLRLGEYPDEGFWDDEEEILPYLHRLPDDLFKAEEAVRKRMGGLSSDREALDLAIEVEDYLADYFRETSVTASHPEGKEVFAWLACEQDSHARVLQEKRDDLKIERVSG